MTSTAASLHFGPEWMRKPARAAPTSPAPNGNGIIPTTSNSNGTTTNSSATATAGSTLGPQSTHSSYSSLLASPMPLDSTNHSDVSKPFKYTREDMYAVWKNGGGQGDLGLEVERWQGIVREEAGEPLGLTEMTQEEKRLYSLPYNSDPPSIRRRGDSYSSTNPMIGTPGGVDSARDRNRLTSPIRTFGGGNASGGTNGVGGSMGIGLPGRRKKDENGQDVPLYRPRQLSLGTNGNLNGPPSPGGPALQSPGGPVRPRLGGTSFDGGVMGDGWSPAGIRRRTSESRMNDRLEGSWRGASFREEITEEPVPADWEKASSVDGGGQPSSQATDATSSRDSAPDVASTTDSTGLSSVPSSDPYNAETVQWSYKDPTGLIQGPFTGQMMQGWHRDGYFHDELLLRRNDHDADFDTLNGYTLRLMLPTTVDNMFLGNFSNKLPLAPPGLVTQPPPAPPAPALDTAFNQIPNQIVPNDIPSLSPISGPTYGDFNQPFGASTNGFSNDLERQRREREDFFRALRERELASQAHTMNNLLGSGLGTLEGMGNALPQGNGLLSNMFQHDGYPNGILPSNDSTRFPLQSQPSFNQPQYHGMNLGGGFGGQNLQPDSIYSPSLQQPKSVWPQRTPQSSVPEYGGFSPVQAPDPTASWRSMLEPVANVNAPFDSAITSFGPQSAHGNAPITPWNQQTNVDPATSFSSVGAALDNSTYPTPPSSTFPPVPIPQLNARPISQPESQADPFATLSNQETASEVSTLPEQLETLQISEQVPDEPAAQLAPPPAVPDAPTIESKPAPKKTSSAMSRTSRSGASSTSSRAQTTFATPEPSVAPSSQEQTPQTPAAATPATPVSGPTKVWGSTAKESAAISLRQIQEAEAKRAAELKEQREKEKAARLAAAAASMTSSPASSLADTPAPWGLPQVGRASGSVTSPSSQSAAAVVAWGGKAAPAVKKTMKEIQEEEERKKREVQAQALAAAPRPEPPVAPAPTPSAPIAAAKRAYADSAKTSSPASLVPAANGWATVGAGGKVVTGQSSSASSVVAARPTGLAALPPRPSAATVTQAAAAASNANHVSKPAAAPKSAPPSKPPADEVPPPSLEFIRWMRDALRGLTGANIDEFIQMLLSFPLDPSPTVMEIISDTVYSNSATLDGRRFAQEFVAKRKADVAAAKTDVKAGSSTGRVSLAEVVKTQSKPVESEWSTRVVKKKSKGRGSSNN